MVRGEEKDARDEADIFREGRRGEEVQSLRIVMDEREERERNTPQWQAERSEISKSESQYELPEESGEIRENSRKMGRPHRCC